MTYLYENIILSQNSCFKSRYNIKMGYSRYISNTFENHQHVYFNKYKLEFNYRVLRHLEAVIYWIFKV
jgi:hypothetical protein